MCASLPHIGYMAEMGRERSAALDERPDATHASEWNDLNRGRFAFPMRIEGIAESHRDGAISGHMSGSHLRSAARRRVCLVLMVWRPYM